MGKSVRKPVRYRFFRIIITLGLLVAGTYLISEWLPAKNRKNWSRKLVEIPVDRITTLVVLQSYAGGEEFSFNRLENDRWQFIAGNAVHPAGMSAILPLLDAVTGLKAIGVRFTTASDWRRFGLADSQSVAVKLFVADQPAAHFHIGLTAYDSVTAKPVTYVRMDGDKNVFMVEGDWGNHFRSPAAVFAMEEGIRFDQQSIQALTFRYPCDSTVVLRKTVNGWQDPARKIYYSNETIRGFLNRFKKLEYTRAAPGFNETTVESAFVDKLELKLADEPEPLVFTRYVTGNPANIYLFQCSLKPYAFYRMEEAEAAASFDWTRMAGSKTPEIQLTINN